MDGFETSAGRRRDYSYECWYGHGLIIDYYAKPGMFVDGRSF